MTDKPSSCPKKASNLKLSLNIFTLVIALIACILAAMAWQKALFSLQTHTQTQQQTHFSTQFKQLQTQLMQQQHSLNNLENKLAQLPTSNQNTQQHQSLIQVAYLLHLANLHLQVGHDVNSALRLLKMAENRVKNSVDPSLFNLKQALSRDTSQLQNASKLDITQIILRLDAIGQDIQSLQLISTQSLTKQLQQTSTTKTKQADNTPWYQKFWHSLANLKDLVIIRNRSEPVMQLLSPKQLALLKENMQLKLLQTQWAALQQNSKLYKANLQTMIRWTNTYYQDNIASKAIITQLQQMLTINISPILPSISRSIKAIDARLVGSQARPSPELNKPNKTKIKTQKPATLTPIIPKVKPEKTTPKAPKNLNKPTNPAVEI